MNETSRATQTSGIEIVFFGTGPVAAESLRFLSEHFIIEAVVTKPRPIHHRGDYPVIDIANKLGAPIVAVGSAEETSREVTKVSFKSKVAVLIDFGIIVRQDVIDCFPLGIINSHFSLLPEWRGADPITFSILSGQKQTGVSLMDVVVKLDEGDVYTVGIIDLKGSETNPSLTTDLIKLSSALLQESIPKLAELKPISQDRLADIISNTSYPRVPSYSHKITKQDGVIDLSKPAIQLEREVRAYLGWPGSRMEIAGKDVVITATHVAHISFENVDEKTIFVANKQLCLQTADGILVIDELKPAGRPAMPATAFLAGYSQFL